MTDKPRIPVTVVALVFVAGVGLISQFLAARAAFALVARDPVHPWFAALLIEAAVVADALAAARTRNEVAVVSLVLALATSGVYNYSVAHSVAPGLHLVVKVALALGPVLALSSVVLALGEELWRYEEQLAEWERVVAQAEAEVQAEARAFELEQAAIEREFERKERRRARLAEQRLERDLALAGRVSAGRSDGRTVTGQMAVDRTDGRRWPDRDAFLSDADRSADLSAGQVAELAGVSARTARRWLAEDRRLRQSVVVDNGREEADGAPTAD